MILFSLPFLAVRVVVVSRVCDKQRANSMCWQRQPQEGLCTQHRGIFYVVGLLPSECPDPDAFFVEKEKKKKEKIILKQK